MFVVLLCGNLQVKNLPATPKEDVYEVENGVMRWGRNNEKVKGFGVNYSAPFANGCRTAQKMGINIKKP